MDPWALLWCAVDPPLRPMRRWRRESEHPAHLEGPARAELAALLDVDGASFESTVLAAIDRARAELHEQARRWGDAHIDDGATWQRDARQALNAPWAVVAGTMPAAAAPAIAIVGTRRLNGAVAPRVRRLVESIVRDVGVAVVSGGALGIDRMAHDAALECGVPAVIVLAPTTKSQKIAQQETHAPPVGLRPCACLLWMQVQYVTPNTMHGRKHQHRLKTTKRARPVRQQHHQQAHRQNNGGKYAPPAYSPAIGPSESQKSLPYSSSQLLPCTPPPPPPPPPQPEHTHVTEPPTRVTECAEHTSLRINRCDGMMRRDTRPSRREGMGRGASALTPSRRSRDGRKSGESLLHRKSCKGWGGRTHGQRPGWKLSQPVTGSQLTLPSQAFTAVTMARHSPSFSIISQAGRKGG